MIRDHLPELLSPAGNLTKLKLAVDFGANAVYLGGQRFGLRSAADNFTLEEIRLGVEYAHRKGVKVFVVLNSFLHDEDFVGLDEFIRHLERFSVDAVIVSDIGVVEWVRRHSNLVIHLSTQASCLNIEAARFWKEQGVSRIVLGREVSLYEAAMIKKLAGIEVEMFIHGSMCMAYSGNCVISNFTQGRDSNRGGCAHSCRFEYSLARPQDHDRHHAFFMSSKDLNGLTLLEQYCHLGIDSIKIEGRMKSQLHVVTLTKIYAQALSYLKKHRELPPALLTELLAESEKISHRAYTLGSLLTPAHKDSIYDEREAEDQGYQFVGSVLDIQESKMVIQVKSPFLRGDVLEALMPGERVRKVKTDLMCDFYGEPITKSRPGSLVFIPAESGIKVDAILRQNVVQQEQSKC